MTNNFYAIDGDGKVHKFKPPKPKFNFGEERWEGKNKTFMFRMPNQEFAENEIYKLIKVSR